jgi:hypothetical protein
MEIPTRIKAPRYRAAICLLSSSSASARGASMKSDTQYPDVRGRVLNRSWVASDVQA